MADRASALVRRIIGWVHARTIYWHFAVQHVLGGRLRTTSNHCRRREAAEEISAKWMRDGSY